MSDYLTSRFRTVLRVLSETGRNAGETAKASNRMACIPTNLHGSFFSQFRSRGPMGCEVTVSEKQRGFHSGHLN